MATRNARALAAYVLHRYDWSESSLILDVFTRTEGRLAVAAKGAKRPYSQLRAVLLPFQRINLALGRGGDAQGEIQTLRSAEWAGGAAMLTGGALFSGFYLNELLMKLLARHDPHPQLFDAYAETLPVLSGQAEAALRAFELTLLREIGVLPDLGIVTLTQQPLQPGERYTLLADAGIVAPRPGHSDLPGATWLALQEALQLGRLDALRAACSTALPELKALLRAQLHYHLGTAVLLTRRAMLDAQRLER